MILLLNNLNSNFEAYIISNQIYSKTQKEIEIQSKTRIKILYFLY